MKEILFLDLFVGPDSQSVTGLSLDVLPIIGDNFSIINSTKYTPNQGDVLYLLPGVTIPRVKLKDLTLNLGIKVTRYPEKANIIISGKGTTGKMTTSKWYHKLETSFVLSRVEELCKDEHYINKLREAISIVNSEYIYMIYSDFQVIRGSREWSPSDHMYSIDKEYLHTFNEVKNKAIYDASDLLDNINGEDAVVIDEEMFQNVKKMFESSDDDNTVLAMEIMANCNYSESIMYLLMLLDQFHNQIFNSNTKNHVNFKGMLSYFNMLPKNLSSIATDKIVKKIDSKGLLTLDMIVRIYEEYTDNIHNRISYDDVFEIKEVTIKQDYLDKLNLTSLNLINPEELGVVTDELIEAAITNIKRDELKSELIAIEEQLSADQGTPEEESNNNQIEKTNGDDFEWF